MVVWLVSAACIISTIYEVSVGKTTPRAGGFWGAVVFHGATALVALWLFLKALGRV
jgi:hypothetical protein